MYYFFYLIMKHALFHLSQKNYASSVLGACPWAAEARSPAEGARQVKNRPAELPSVQLGQPFVTARAAHQYANHMRGDRDRSQRRHVKASHLLLTRVTKILATSNKYEGSASYRLALTG